MRLLYEFPQIAWVLFSLNFIPILIFCQHLFTLVGELIVDDGVHLSWLPSQTSDSLTTFTYFFKKQ